MKVLSVVGDRPQFILVLSLVLSSVEGLSK